MLNQVLLKGKIVEIYEESIDIEADGVEHPIHISNIRNVDNLLFNNIVAIRGYLNTSSNGAIIVMCDTLIILDGRGKRSE